MLRDYITYDIVRDEVIGDDESRKFAECNELAVDSDGSFYIKGYSDDTLLKISSNGYYRWSKKFTQWGDTYLNEVESVFVGPNGTVYVGTYGWDGNIKMYLLNASTGNIEAQWYNNHIGTITTIWVDNEDNVYTMGIGPGETPHLVIFDPNGTELDYRRLPYYSGVGSIGSNHGNSIAVNSFGDIFLLDRKNREVHVYHPDISDNFTWQASQFGKPGDIFIDDQDNIYICDEDQTYDRIQVFDRNRRLLSEWNTELTETCIYVGDDDKIYVGGNTGSGTYRGRIISFDLKSTLNRVGEDLLAEDTDEDGLPDDVEAAGWTCNTTTPDGIESKTVFSSQKLFDTDNDGLNDSHEMDLLTDPNSTDTDKDGLGDYYELENGTDPLNFDSDGDRLSDSLELHFGSDPEKQDTDDDGLDDWWEFKLGTNPRDPDTDDDGLSDYDEKQSGYDPLDPDPDRDSLFDGDEYDLGSGAYKADNDGDGIIDGMEIVYKTDPTSGDSDGDLLPDGYELEMKLDPVNNDTDGDGMLDSRELEIGYSPFSADTDGDGIPDSKDMDFTIDLDNITMISDGTREALELMGNIVSSGSVEGVDLTPKEGRGNTNPFIVIVGEPSSENGTAGKLILDLLSAHPDLLKAMNDSLENRFVVRYGVWSPNQTVILLSKPLENDHNRILGLFRSVLMTVEAGHVMADYLSPVGFVNLDSFDLTRSVDAAIFCDFNENTTLSVDLRSPDYPLVAMNGSTGIPIDLLPLGRFLEVNLTGNVSMNRSILRIYYRLKDLDRNGDGDTDDEGDIDESTLRLFRLENETWIDITSVAIINTTDQKLNGKHYAGYISADLDHFSFFGLAGEGYEIGTYELEIGPIMDEEDQVVENATVIIYLDGSKNSSFTDSDGRTVFILPRNMADMPVTVSISGEGYHDLNHSTNITSGGILEEQPPRLKKIREVVDNVTKFFFLKIGPLLNTTGDMVEGCSIRIEVGNLTLDGITDAQGEASFNLSEDLMGSSIVITATKEGYENISHTTSISMQGELEEVLPRMVVRQADDPVEEPDDEDDDDGTDFDWMIILILIILLVIIAAVVVISRRSRSELEEE
jgi:hypothetical protein